MGERRQRDKKMSVSPSITPGIRLLRESLTPPSSPIVRPERERSESNQLGRRFSFPQLLIALATTLTAIIWYQTTAFVLRAERVNTRVVVVEGVRSIYQGQPAANGELIPVGQPIAEESYRIARVKYPLPNGEERVYASLPLTAPVYDIFSIGLLIDPNNPHHAIVDTFLNVWGTAFAALFLSIIALVNARAEGTLERRGYAAVRGLRPTTRSCAQREKCVSPVVPTPHQLMLPPPNRRLTSTDLIAYRPQGDWSHARPIVAAGTTNEKGS